MARKRRLDIEITDSRRGTGFRDAGREVDNFGTKLGRGVSKWTTRLAGFASFAGIALAGIGAAGVSFGLDMARSASDVREALNKSNQVFKSQGARIERWAEDAARNLGLSQGAALDAVGSFGNMFDQLGLTEKASADMSTQIVTLAADFASFHNADITDVVAAQSAAFRGEYDALQRFLPLISAATVQQKAMEQTGKGSADQLTAQEKALATFSLMLEGAGEARGDFARTAEDAANAERIANAELENTRVAIGEKLLPLQELWTDAKLRLAEIVVDDVLPALEDFWEEIEGPVKTAVDGVTSWVKDDLIPTLGDLWEWFKEHILPELKKFWKVITEDVVPNVIKFWRAVGDLLRPLGSLSGRTSALEKLFGQFSFAIQILTYIAGGSAVVLGFWAAVFERIGDAIDWIVDRLRALGRAIRNLPSLSSVASGLGALGGVIGGIGAIAGFFGGAHGGIVGARGIQGFAAGGLANTDVVPALLSHGEMVLTEAQQANLFRMARDGRGMGGGQPVVIDMRGSIVADEREFERMVHSAFVRLRVKGVA